MALLKCSNGIVFIIRRDYDAQGIAVYNNDRKGWPVTKILPDRSPICAEKSEIETVVTQIRFVAIFGTRAPVGAIPIQ